MTYLSIMTDLLAEGLPAPSMSDERDAFLTRYLLQVQAICTNYGLDDLRVEIDTMSAIIK